MKTDGGDQFGAYYYRHDCGIPYERNDHWLSFFSRVADTIVSKLQPASALDAGCAMGFLVESLRNRGVEAYGVDVSEYAISKVHPSVREHCWAASLTEPLPRTYDLITCVEVIEHINPADAEKVIANLCNATDRLLLSTSPFDYAEPTHVNVQPPEVWSSLLAREGFLRDLDHDATYLTPWAALYRRTDESLSDTVRRYDRAWWRLHWEVSEVRRSLLDLQQRLEEAEEERVEAVAAATQAARAEQQDAPSSLPHHEIDAEIAELKEEILRLRDQVIGKNAELGTALGRVAELEAWNARYLESAERLEAVLRSRSWRVMWALGTPLRRLRRSQSS